MPVPDADPQAVSLDEAFARAMEAPAKPREVAPPDEVDLDAPFGREDDGTPKAPYGLKSDGKPRRSAGGRRPRDEQPRVGEVEKDTSVTGKVKKPQAAPEPRDYSEGLADAANMAWLGLSAGGMVLPKVPVVGKFLPEDKVGSVAAIFKHNSPALCGAINLAAQHNAKAAKVAAKLAAGDVTWQATCLFMVLPFAMQTAAVLRGDEAMVGMGMPKAADLAAKNASDLQEYMGQLAAQMQQAQAEASGGLAEPVAEGTAA